jgi:hypothetical protein
MTLAHPRRLATLLSLGLVLAACSQAAPSSSTLPTPNIPASPSASPSASAPASLAPTAAPTASPVASPSAAACALPPAGTLPSDRFTDLTVASGPNRDRLTFTFGNPSLPGPASPPQGSLEAASPPYSQASSGAAITMLGEHVLALRFTGMSLSNDVGQPTYDGPRELKPDFDALRHAVLFDASEGVVGWYIGYDGTGCPTLTRNGDDLVLAIPKG